MIHLCKEKNTVFFYYLNAKFDKKRVLIKSGYPNVVRLKTVIGIGIVHEFTHSFTPGETWHNKSMLAMFFRGLSKPGGNPHNHGQNIQDCTESNPDLKNNHIETLF